MNNVLFVYFNGKDAGIQTALAADRHNVRP
jgi:hypothetical protein